VGSSPAGCMRCERAELFRDLRANPCSITLSSLGRDLLDPRNARKSGLVSSHGCGRMRPRRLANSRVAPAFATRCGSTWSPPEPLSLEVSTLGRAPALQLRNLSQRSADRISSLEQRQFLRCFRDNLLRNLDIAGSRSPRARALDSGAQFSVSGRDFSLATSQGHSCRMRIS
jgi:hypothetical protein